MGANIEQMYTATKKSKGTFRVHNWAFQGTFGVHLSQKLKY